MATFRSLPAELVLEIGGWLDERYSLSALAKANCVCRSILMPLLFTRYGTEAVRWAAEMGNLDILKAATFFARSKKGDLLNAKYIYDGQVDNFDLDRPIFNGRVFGEKYATPLHTACAAGHIDIVTYLLENGADMDMASNRFCECLYMDDCLGEYYGDDDIIDRPKWLPLHEAICHKHPEIAILLLERGAPLYVSASSASKGRYSVTALQSAAENGLVTVVQYLKERFQKQKAALSGPEASDPTDAHEFGNELDTLLAEADEAMDSGSDVENGDPFDSEMSDFDGLEDDEDEDDEDEDDDDLDSESISDDSDGSTGTDDLDFWGQSADPSDPRSADLYGNTAMHYVSLCFDFEAACTIVKDLQELGLNVDERGGRRDATPLLMACCMGNFSAARAFLRAGAFPEAVLEEDFVEYDGLEGDTTCLDNALYAKHSDRAAKRQSESRWKQERYDFIKELVKAGVDVEELPGTSDATPLGIAAQGGLEDEVKLLIELGGAYVNGMADAGKTALMAAAQRKQIGAVRILLEAGAAVNQVTGFGVTAVDFACSAAPHSSPDFNKSEEILKVLLEYGARVGIPVEDPHAAMCHRTPCIHDSFLLKMVRRASRTARDDNFDGENENKCINLLGVLLDHSTEANITRDCWQAATMEAFSPLKSEAANPAVCKRLGEFGARLGYVFDDAILANIIVKLIVADEPADLEALFLFGDGECVRTVTGVLTKTALLTLILVRQHCEDGNECKLIGALLESVTDVKGTIRLLKNKGTLLHLAASGKNVDHVRTLLDRGCDLGAMNLHSMTPLAEAVKGGDIKIVKLLLDRGADPYLSNSQMSPPLLPDTTKDVLQPPSGQRLARALIEMLAKFDCIPSLYLDEPSPFDIVSFPLCFSPVHVVFCTQITLLIGFITLQAVRKGRNLIIEEFIKRKKVIPPIPSSSSVSYMTQACNHQHYQTVHLLLRAGADPNGGEGVHTPPVVSLLTVLQYVGTFFNRDTEKKRAEALKMLGVVAHLIQAGADVNKKAKANKQSAVMVLTRILDGGTAPGIPLDENPESFSELREFPLAQIVQEVLTIKEDESGKKTIKCLNRGIDSWVR